MSNKVLLFSDPHIHTHKQSLTRLKDCLQATEWVFQTALERGIKDVICLGDLFQDRQNIKIFPYYKTFELIKKYSKNLRICLLVGNHDMFFDNRSDISSIYPFSSIENVTVISSPTSIEILGQPIDFIPFTRNPIESLNTLKVINSGARILCGHLALDGAKLNNTMISEISVEHENETIKVDASQFQSWKRVFLGHYHGEQRIEHIEYVGSLLQLNFAEAFQQKHIIELDVYSLEQNYIVNTISPVHMIVDEDKLDQYNLNNTFLKIRPKDISSSHIIDLRDKLLSEYEIHSLDFKSPQDHEETEQQVSETKHLLVKDKLETLERYIEAVNPTNMDTSLLLKIGRDICEKSLSE